MYTFTQLLHSSKLKEILNVANFCVSAFKKLEQPYFNSNAQLPGYVLYYFFMFRGNIM